MQTKAVELAQRIIAQFDKYGENFSIQQNLNCTDIYTAYHEYKSPLCGEV